MTVGQSSVSTVTAPSDRAIDRPVLALGVSYPDGHVTAAHSHGRGQFLYGSTGVVLVSTAQGAWMMPPQRGLWIPAGVEHDVRMLGAVTMCSLYVDEAAVPPPFARCQVVGVSDLMRSLLVAAPGIAPEYDRDGRDGALVALIVHELRALSPLPLSLPLPAHPALAERCRAFLERPSPHETIEAWCDAVAMSRRSFTRLFRRETGLSFVEWRQRACLMAALPRLAAGEGVTSTAIALGFENPASFTQMFKRLLGVAPSLYRTAADDGGG